MLHWDNGVYLGYCYRETCGYYYFVSIDTGGSSWPAHALRAIADTLDELNKDWDEQVTKMLSNE